MPAMYPLVGRLLCILISNEVEVMTAALRTPLR